MAEEKSFKVHKAGSRYLERPLYKRLKNLLGQQPPGSLRNPLEMLTTGVSLLQILLFHLINLCTFDILVLYLLP